MHSSTIRGLKRPDEPEVKGQKEKQRDMRLRSSTTTKAEMLKSRDLQRYTNQLRVAKNKCEKRISTLGKLLNPPIYTVIPLHTTY